MFDFAVYILAHRGGSNTIPASIRQVEAMLNQPTLLSAGGVCSLQFGDILHSRKWNMQKIETGIKFVIYNIRLLIRYRIRTEMELLD